MAFGTNEKQGRISISPRDYARFGWLFANKCKWNNIQMLDETLCVMATTDPLPSDFPMTKAIPAQMLPNQRSIGSLRFVSFFFFLFLYVQF